MFKNLLARFSKKESISYESLSLETLSKGCIFEYDLATWQVLEVYTYDWGNESFSKEYKVSNGKNSLFLSVENDGELELVLSKKVKIRSIKEDLPEQIIENETVPKSISYNGKSYLLDGEFPGYFNDGTNKEWEEFISWELYDESEKNIITIEQWGEKEFEASTGIKLETHEISNLLPAPKN
jgi:hypothetical protein